MQMGTLEAVSTITALWPKCFQPADKWRQALVDEFEHWSPEDLGRAVERVRATHSSRRVSIDTFRAARGHGPAQKRMSDMPEQEGSVTQSYGYATQKFLIDHDLWDQYKRATAGDQVMIRRLVAVLMLTPGWELILERQAGDPRYFPAWDRIDNLVHAADKATVETRGGPIKACYPVMGVGASAIWVAPKVAREVTLPDPPVPINSEESRAGVGRILAIARKHGGVKATSCGAIFEDPEYQQYLADYTARTGRQPA